MIEAETPHPSAEAPESGARPRFGRPRPAPTRAELEKMVVRLRRRLALERTVFLSLAVVAAGCYLVPLLMPGKWAVYVNGKPVVAMRGRAELATILARVKRAGGASDATFTQPVRIAPAGKTRVPVLNARAAEQRLSSAVKLRAQRAVIYVDGVPVVAVPTPADASAVLDRVKAPFAQRFQELITAPSFRQKVTVRTEPADSDIWADPDTAVGLLQGETGDDRSHTVAAGETAWQIARAAGLTASELKKANPDADLARLHPGETLRIAKQSPPLLTVVTEGRLTETVGVPFETELRTTPAMYLGKRVLKRHGKPGKELVTYRIKAENGTQIFQEVLERKTLEAPVSKVVVLGSRPRPHHVSPAHKSAYHGPSQHRRRR